MEATENRWTKQFRLMTLALIFSGALNIGFVAAFLFSSLQDKSASLAITPLAKGGKKQEMTNQQVFAQMAKLSFRELVAYLTNRDPLEEGYAKRDLALAALVSFHHFNLEKAISATPQVRFLPFGEERKMPIFPGLSDEQFEAVVRFAYEEKWPLTSEGLFLALKKWPEPKEESLVQAFSLTPEFHALQLLFQKTEAPQDVSTLVRLVLEGNWDLLDRYAREQSQMLDLSVEKRRRLLLSYLALQSPAAAELLLHTDLPFVSKRLDDRGIVDIVHLLQGKTPEAERLCADLLRSPRTDFVWKAAAEALYAFSGESCPSPLDFAAAKARFVPSSLAAAALMPASAPPSFPPVFRQHIVKERESLWKIAHHYKVKLDELVKLNQLEKDQIYPGMTLRIPQTQGTGSEPPR